NVYLLSFLSTMEELAFYSIADSIVASSSLLTQVYLSLAIPAFSRLHSANNERLKAMHSRSLLILSSLALPIAIIVSFQATTVSALWGERFRGAAPVIGLLIWSLVISWLNATNSGVMIATGHERVSARFLALALGINLFAGFILIPSGGAIGATVARLTAELAFVSAQWLFVCKNVSKTPIGVLTSPAMAAIVMGLTRFLLGRAILTWEALCISLFMYAIVLVLGLFFSRR
ncbi:MAG: polysaccharide biosynthesis C-terminal domain-containing protein, partial [Anaerolineae bacterium]